MTFERRVRAEYLIPNEGDEIACCEGLYTLIIVPQNSLTKRLVVQLDEHCALYQKVMQRYLIPEKTGSDSPEGYYPTILIPNEYLNKVVTILEE